MTDMKRIRFVSIGVALLLLGANAPGYAQEHAGTDDKPQHEQEKAQGEKAQPRQGGSIAAARTEAAARSEHAAAAARPATTAEQSVCTAWTTGAASRAGHRLAAASRDQLAVAASYLAATRRVQRLPDS